MILMKCTVNLKNNAQQQFSFCCVLLWFGCKPISWWFHHMETFSVLLPLCAENSPVTGEFPSQRSVMWNFDIFFDLRLKKWLSKRLRCWWFEMPLHLLWHHCNVIFQVISLAVVKWNISWTYSWVIHIESELRQLMARCFSTRTSAAIILSNTQLCLHEFFVIYGLGPKDYMKYIIYSPRKYKGFNCSWMMLNFF